MSAGIVMWECGKCHTWNKIESIRCTKCDGCYDEWHVAIRYHNQLTPQEEQFYQVTAPMLLRELRSLRNLLERHLGGIQ